jgi:hypothetical protein
MRLGKFEGWFEFPFGVFIYVTAEKDWVGVIF